ncbi:ABC transporter permease [Alkalimarinus alittae]|uniref:Iron ABC transporter permease n=1 Tax=Alkalimarinus alittae TaxID=2961619 RepID=A0ABY6N6B7_9ALTE|nr:iron ABC transporter permease [Alkalimarinus alittae]UZE97670.1 iron ABC transporter permease [Alkalimarinus alittae]
MYTQTNTLSFSRFFRNPWFMSSAFIAFMVGLPIIAVFYLAFYPEENIWPHLIDTVLPGYVSSTLILMAGVGSLSLFMGVGSAWLVTMCKFPGRKMLEWALLLPFAVPAYVIAYVYTDLLEYAGIVQGSLREVFGWTTYKDYWFPEIRSMGGAITMMALVLYPYVYLMSRAAFLEQSMSLFSVSRNLGHTPLQSFLKVSLPVARPAIAVGLSLTLMETLNDFGTVDFFAVKTLTAGLYDTWLNMNNLGGAAQIASLMLIFVVTLIYMERFSRRKQKQFESKNQGQSLEQFQLRGIKAAAATFFCLLPVVAGFLIPICVLGYYAFLYFDVSWTSDFVSHAINSFTLSVIAAITTIVLGVALAYSKRLNAKGITSLLVRFSGLGYAMPGAVLAVGIIVPFAAFDNALDDFLRQHFGVSTGLLLSGTTFAIIFAYTVRFLAVSAGSVESSLAKVTPSMDMASRSLGRNTFSTLIRVHLPIIRGGILTAALVVFVDSMKELPATLILRPFNFETLATHVYQLASDELLEQSALASLIIVLVGIAPVIFLSRSISSSRAKR